MTAGTAGAPRPVVQPGASLGLPLQPRVPDVERIVVLRANGIGDFVMGLPALEALRAAYPDAEITYLGLPWHQRLLPGRPGPWDRVELVPRWPGVRGERRDPEDVLTEFFAHHRSRHYDLAVQLHGGGRNSNPFVRELGGRVSVGAATDDAPPLDRQVVHEFYAPEVIRWLEVAALAGAAPVTLVPRLSVLPTDVADADTALEAAEREIDCVPPRHGPLVVVHPGAGDPRRRWPIEKFADVTDELAAEGARVVAIGSDRDAELVAKLQATARHPVLDLAGRLSLGGTLGVIAAADVFVGNDSGPRHLAEAVGTRTVGIYWCGNAISCAPLTRGRHRVLLSFRTNCPVCGANQGASRCPHDASFVADVEVDTVRDAVRHLLRQESH